jgi:hypothetical protein
MGHGFTGGQQKLSALLSPPLHTCDGASSHTMLISSNVFLITIFKLIYQIDLNSFK